MNFGNEDIQYQNALKTKLKRENIIMKNLPFKCKKCGKEKFPGEFVKQYMKSPYFGEIQILSECKECKRKRISDKRKDYKNSAEGSFDAILNQLRQSAKTNGTTFDIDEKYLLYLRDKQKGKCFFSGYNMSFEKGKYQIFCDRINNKLGYVKGNILLCTNIVYKMKQGLNSDEFVEICKDITKKLG